jgi:hypothetical protein
LNLFFLLIILILINLFLKRYLYTAEIELCDYNDTDIVNSMIAANELGLNVLYNYLNNYFIKKHQDHINGDPVKLLTSICSNKEGLKDFNLEVIFVEGENSSRSTKEIKSLEKSILLYILDKNNLFINEIETWQDILKWGLSKHLEIKNDNPEEWTSQNFVDLRNTLKDLILLIRFKDITIKNFRYDIIPYQKLFPKDLWETLLDYYLIPDNRSSTSLLPSRIPKIDSTIIINPKLLLLFASWIDKMNPPYNSFKYDFKLLFRSSRDGLEPVKFHQKCDDIDKTLSIGKIQNSEQIFGGYNPLNWNGGGQWKNANESFIFNINNRDDSNTAKVSYVVKNQGNAIYCYQSNLPTFGGGNDLRFQNGGTITVIGGHTYNNINLVSGSKFDELEVFQIINRN